MENVIKIKVEPYNPSRTHGYRDYDMECGCCQRPIRNRETATVVVRRSCDEPGFAEFLPIPEHELPNDPVEWGTFIGSHCAKALPKTHKVTYRKLLKNHSDTWV